jgi:hypothetical protein
MELIEKLDLMDKKLDKLLAGGVSGEPPATEPPAGFVAVRPTGPRGAGKVRFWPVTIPEDINYLSYLNRMMRIVNPFSVKGEMFCTPGQWGDGLYPDPALQNVAYPDHADRHMNPFDWFTQAELDKIAALAERDRDHGFSPGG